MSWYKGSAGKFTVTTTETFDEMVVLLVRSGINEVSAKFAYPIRDGFTELVKDGDNYAAIMTEEQTRSAKAGPHNVEVKLFKADGTRPIGIAKLKDLEFSEVGKIDES